MFNKLCKVKFGEKVSFVNDIVFVDVCGINVVFQCKKTIRNFCLLSKLCSYVKELPAEIQCHVKNNVNVLRLDDFKEFDDSYNDTLGFFRHEDKAIYIRCSYYYSRCMKRTLYHEIGHLIDSLNYDNSNCKNLIDLFSISDEELHDIAGSEMSYYWEEYYKSSIQEYFAESFARYYLNDSFAKKCPNTFKKVSEYIQAL